MQVTQAAHGSVQPSFCAQQSVHHLQPDVVVCCHIQLTAAFAGTIVRVRAVCAERLAEITADLIWSHRHSYLVVTGHLHVTPALYQQGRADQQSQGALTTAHDIAGPSRSAGCDGAPSPQSPSPTRTVESAAGAKMVDEIYPQQRTRFTGRCRTSAREGCRGSAPKKANIDAIQVSAIN